MLVLLWPTSFLKQENIFAQDITDNWLFVCVENIFKFSPSVVWKWTGSTFRDVWRFVNKWKFFWRSSTKIVFLLDIRCEKAFSSTQQRKAEKTITYNCDQRNEEGKRFSKIQFVVTLVQFTFRPRTWIQDLTAFLSKNHHSLAFRITANITIPSPKHAGPE